MRVAAAIAGLAAADDRAARPRLAAPLAWERLLEAGEIDERLVADQHRASRARPQPVPPARLAPPGLAARAARGRDRRRSTPTSSRRSRPRAAANVIVTSGTASGKSLSFNLPVLDAIAARPEGPRALPLPDQGARPGPGAQARPSSASPALRHAIYDGDTPREDRPGDPPALEPVLTNPDMLNMALLAHHKGWGDFLANLRLGRRRRGAHLPRRLRLARRQRAAPAAPGRPPLRLRAALHPRLGDDRQPASSSPSGSSGAPFTLVDADGAPRARRRIAIWNPPVIDPKTMTPPLGALRGGRAARRPGRSPASRTICFLAAAAGSS